MGLEREFFDPRAFSVKCYLKTYTLGLIQGKRQMVGDKEKDPASFLGQKILGFQACQAGVSACIDARRGCCARVAVPFISSQSGQASSFL